MQEDIFGTLNKATKALGLGSLSDLPLDPISSVVVNNMDRLMHQSRYSDHPADQQPQLAQVEMAHTIGLDPSNSELPPPGPLFHNVFDRSGLSDETAKEKTFDLRETTQKIMKSAMPFEEV